MVTKTAEEKPKQPDERVGPASQAAASGVPQIILPRVPKLTAGIELAGEMQESAFKEPPFLIKRDGQFIQTPELLYRVAEQIDGQREVNEVGRRASEATRIALSADEIKQLLAKLYLMGVITDSQGKSLAQNAGAGFGGYSPLALNMRTAVVRPGLVRPIATLLRPLHWPPVILAVLAAGAVALWWVFFVHGLGTAIHDAFYTPGLMLAFLGLIILSAVFHEFGHASALEYNGGRVKSMGVGLYMIYPAFYTDVTDSYRLPRWARMRTDLGGLYFNLIFALALTGIYLLAGGEFLLIVVALIVFEMLHQLLPLGRLDGYWALADLIGMPDFFSRIGSFLRSILPGWAPLPKGSELPPLKTHAKLVFAAYITVTIPLLLFMLFLMLRAVPRMVATGVDAFIEQSPLLEDAVNRRDVVMVAATLVQMLVLVMMTGGVFYLLFRLGRRLGTGLWNWSKPTMPRRFAGSVMGAGMVFFLAFLWAPQLPIPGGGSGPLYNATSFKPIQKGERLTLGDATGQRIVTRPYPGAPSQEQSASGGSTTPPGQNSAPSGQAPQSGQQPGQSNATGGSNPGATSAPNATQQPTYGGTTAPTAEATPEPTPQPTQQTTVTPTPGVSGP